MLMSRTNKKIKGSLMIEFTALATLLIFLLTLAFETERFLKVQFYLKNAAYRLAIWTSLNPTTANCTNVFTQLNNEGGIGLMSTKGTFFVTGLTTGNAATNTILWSRRSTTTNPSHTSQVTTTYPALSSTTAGYTGTTNTVVVEVVFDYDTLFSYFIGGQYKQIVAIDYRGTAAFPAA